MWVLVAAEPSLLPLIEIFIEMILASERERESVSAQYSYSIDQDCLELMPLLPQCCTTMPSAV